VKPCFAIARNFQLKDSLTDRLLVADGESWRSPTNDELDSLTPEASSRDEAACCSLMSLPAHMSARFWSMLNEEVADGTGNFDEFSEDLAEFLSFKGLSLPAETVCELLIQEAGGQVKTDDVWALINFGDEAVLLAWPRLRLRLGPAEGCLMPKGLVADVIPPQGEDMNVLFAVRLPPA
jgi:hypothetical protein